VDEVASPPEPAVGLLTLADWAQRIGRAPRTVINHWRPRPGFPPPAARLPGPARGGVGRLLYERRALDAWRETQPDLGLPRRVDLSQASFDPEARVSLGWFAEHVAGVARKTVTQYRGKPGFPLGDARNTYRAGDLAQFWSARPGKRGPSRPPRGE
jgi:hypothetical protein